MGPRDALASEAFTAGRRAGLGLLAPSLNPHPEGAAEHLQWQQGHQSAVQSAANYADETIRRDQLRGYDETRRDFNMNARYRAA